MSLASFFLNLSMKEQIIITIFALTFFCIIVILIVSCSLIYEILNKDCEQKKLYFYNRFKDYMESAFYFQNFYLMQYEENIHRMKKQLWRIQQSVSIYNNSHPLQIDKEHVIDLSLVPLSDSSEDDLNNTSDETYFYIFPFSASKREHVYNFALNHYQSFSHSILTHDIYDFFRIPGYNVPIIEDPLFYSINYSTLFSFNKSKIKGKILEFIDMANSKEITPEMAFNNTLNEVIDQYVNLTQYYIQYSQDDDKILPLMYEKFNKELQSYSPDIFTNESVLLTYSNMLATYITGIEYENEKIQILTSEYDKFQNYYFTQINLIPDLLFFLNNKLTYSLDIDFIPIHLEINTILSEELCALFKIKQEFLSGNEFNFEDISKNIIKMETNIDGCFKYLEYIKEQEVIKDIFEEDFLQFVDPENMIYQGIFNLIPNNSDSAFYFIKYSFPNYNSLIQFQTEYFFFNQVNYFGFTSFRLVQKYVEHLEQITMNIFFLIIMVIIYIWIFCLFTNLIIFAKVIDKWTEPITKLQEAVETSNIKDENIFKYEYDDIINELFLTCKELLTGQIDNTNENGIKNFNILGKEKDNKIDTNIYKKNLIINNEIMEELILKQQSMLDFSNNIKINEPLSSDNSVNSNTIPITKKITFSKDNIINLNKAQDKEDKENIKKQGNKENEPYIKLFKIAEYLYYYRSKIETNNVSFANAENDETKMSKMISKNTKSNNSSVSHRNDETNEQNNINMLDEKNISYLWYMEAKKKYKNFNYTLSSDYKELFTEFNDSYKTISRSEMKKSNYLNKKEKKSDQ